MENIVIVGGGPAGVSAALYAVRANKNPLVIENGPRALKHAESIENYYGNEELLSGAELYEKGIRQAKKLGVRFLKAEVLGIEGFDTFMVKTTKGDFETVSVILATGSKRMTPKIPGIRELEGKGVSYCAVCDAFFYRGKTTAVLGNGDFALHEAEVLSNTAGNVLILTDGAKENFSRKPEAEVLTGKIAAIIGEERVHAVRFEDGTEQAVDGLFVAMGNAGSGEIARQMGAELTEKGMVKVDENMRTTIPGLYAAGDCTGGLLQVAKAVYEGCLAGIDASKYVRDYRREHLEAEALELRQD